MENELRYINAVLETGSISGAAQQLSISQPALSAFISRVEAKNSITLLNRNRSRLTLSEEGKAYLEYLKLSEQQESDFHKRISDIRNGTVGTLTLGGSSCFNSLYIPQAVAAFRQEFPAIEVQIIDGTVNDNIERTLSGEMDLFLSPLNARSRGLVFEKLFDESVLLVLPREWKENDTFSAYRIPETALFDGQPIANRFPAVPYTAFNHQPFIRLKKELQIGNIAMELLSRSQMEETASITVDQMNTALALTAAGLGATLITETALHNSNMKQMPAVYAIDADLAIREMYMVRAENNYLSKACNRFMMILRNKFQK